MRFESCKTCKQRPYLSSEPVVAKLCTESGTILAGVFYEDEMKLVPRRHKLRISGFYNQYVVGKQLYYTVTIESLPRNALLSVTKSQLNDFDITQVALRELQNLKNIEKKNK